MIVDKFENTIQIRYSFRCPAFVGGTKFILHSGTFHAIISDEITEAY